jgi:hypothetical protein
MPAVGLIVLNNADDARVHDQAGEDPSRIFGSDTLLSSSMGDPPVSGGLGRRASVEMYDARLETAV